MILNPCTKFKTMADENECKTCKDKNCKYANQLTTAERLKLNTATYGLVNSDDLYVPNKKS